MNERCSFRFAIKTLPSPHQWPFEVTVVNQTLTMR
ncbi:Uncharacterised protein [Vibrio cholerae]|nr:Uncharacterised protein [Vibrio cholerae]